MGENLRISSYSILGSPSSYMTLHPIPSEFPYIWGKFSFLFYQRDVRTTLFSLLSDCSTVQEWKVWPAWQNHPHHLLASMCLASVPHRRRGWGGDLATSVAICVYTVCTVQYTNTYKILQESHSRSFLFQNVILELARSGFPV